MASSLPPELLLIPPHTPAHAQSLPALLTSCVEHGCQDGCGGPGGGRGSACGQVMEEVVLHTGPGPPRRRLGSKERTRTESEGTASWDGRSLVPPQSQSHGAPGRPKHVRRTSLPGRAPRATVSSAGTDGRGRGRADTGRPHPTLAWMCLQYLLRELCGFWAEKPETHRPERPSRPECGHRQALPSREHQGYSRPPLPGRSRRSCPLRPLRGKKNRRVMRGGGLSSFW